jgi:hypothetical protein
LIGVQSRRQPLLGFRRAYTLRRIARAMAFAHQEFVKSTRRRQAPLNAARAHARPMLGGGKRPHVRKPEFAPCARSTRSAEFRERVQIMAVGGDGVSAHAPLVREMR